MSLTFASGPRITCMTEWYTDQGETFHFMSANFDVSAAKQILAQKAHKVGQLDISDVADMIGLPGKMTAGIHIDWNRVQDGNDIDLTVPVIFAHTKAGSFLPIDGWHRIATAKLRGIPHLPAVALNKGESKRCWLK